nr:hypothetical protein [uncultured Nocardioides sp.]
MSTDTVTHRLGYARERTLSTHSINTTQREAWYWLVVLRDRSP